MNGKGQWYKNFKIEVRKQREWSRPAKSDSTGKNKEEDQGTHQTVSLGRDRQLFVTERTSSEKVICHRHGEILEYQTGGKRVMTFLKEKKGCCINQGFPER